MPNDPMIETSDPSVLSPVITESEFYFKRDDAFVLHPKFPGTKARVAAIVAKGQSGLVTVHKETAPQGPLVAGTAHICRIPCRIHTLEKFVPSLHLLDLYGAMVIGHKSKEKMRKAATNDAKLTGFKYMPVNLDCTEGTQSIIKQCKNIPDDTERVFINVKTGSAAQAILLGLREHKKKAQLIVGCENPQAVTEYFREMVSPGTWEERVMFKHNGKDKISGKPKDLIWLGNIL